MTAAAPFANSRIPGGAQMAIIKEKKLRLSSVIENLTADGIVEGEAEKTELTTEGFLKSSDTGFEISYTEMTEGGKVISDIIITETSVDVKRRGAIESDMHFSEGALHKSLYTVAPYSFDSEIVTRKIRNNMTRDGGKVDIFYNMKIGGAEKSVKMRIEAF